LNADKIFLLREKGAPKFL